MALVKLNGEVVHAGEVLRVALEDTSRYDDFRRSLAALVWSGGKESLVWLEGEYRTAECVADATPEVIEAHAKYTYELQARRSEYARTKNTIKKVYTIRNGCKVRVVRGRKIPVGSVHKCTSVVMPNAFNRYGSVVHLIGENGIHNRYVDCYNLECVPAVADIVDECGESELRCPCCHEMKPVSEFIYSLQESFGQTRGPNDHDCLSCAVAVAIHADLGSELHNVGLAFVAEPCEFTAAVLADCLDEQGKEVYSSTAYTIRKNFKVGKKVSKPRKKKEAAIA